jgi:RimJ/RimL family protein N-acetyltransferase
VDRHPLLDILTEAALGRPPAANGALTLVPALPGPMHCVLGFTAHHVIAADIEEEVVRQRVDPADLGQPMSSSFLMFLGGWLGAEPGTFDVVFVAPPPERADDSLELWRRTDLEAHPRVRRAGRYRPEVSVYADRQHGEPDGLLVIGQGVAGRWELAYEVAPHAQGRGLGRRLAAAASSLVPDGEPVFAQVAAGNVASIRACVAAGFRALHSEVLFVPH